MWFVEARNWSPQPTGGLSGHMPMIAGTLESASCVLFPALLQSSYHEQHKALVAQYAGFLHEWDAAHLAPFSAAGFTVHVQKGDGDGSSEHAWVLQRSSKPTKRARAKTAPAITQQRSESASVLFTAQLAVASMYWAGDSDLQSKAASTQPQGSAQQQLALTVGQVRQWAAETSSSGSGAASRSKANGSEKDEEAAQGAAASGPGDDVEQGGDLPPAGSSTGSKAGSVAYPSMLQPLHYHLRVQHGAGRRHHQEQQAAEYEVTLGEYPFLRVRNIKARK
jgi:hypothetical protein